MEEYKLTNLHYFEVMDRSYIAVDTFNEHIVDHAAVQANPELKEKAKEVADLMYQFYCLTSAYMDDAPGENRARSRAKTRAKKYKTDE